MKLTREDIIYAVCGKDNPDPIGFGAYTVFPKDIADYFGIDRLSSGMSYAYEKETDEVFRLIVDLSERFDNGDYGTYDNSNEIEISNELDMFIRRGYYPTPLGEIRIEKSYRNSIEKRTIYFDFEE